MKPSILSYLSRNFAIILGLAAVFLLLEETVPGLQFAVRQLAIKNLQQMAQLNNKQAAKHLPPLDRFEKMGLKIESWSYIEFLLRNTPMDAVILLPPDTIFDKNEGVINLSDADWMEYFVYPRLCISESAKNQYPDLYKSVTHVAIIKYWGYDHLHYPVREEKQQKYEVLPIAQPLDDYKN